MKLCALLPYPLDTVPGQRYRIEQWRPYLEGAGISVELLPALHPQLVRRLHAPGHLAGKAAGFLGATGRRLAQLVHARAADVVLVYRALFHAGPPLLESLLRVTGRPVVLDFDDAIHVLHTTSANRRFAWLKFPGKTAHLCRLSDAVSVGNSYLADYARQFSAHVSVVPSSIDTELYRPRPSPRPAGGPVVVGWMGSSTSQTYLEGFVDVLRGMVRPGVELRVVSDREPHLPGVECSWRRWSAATEVDELAGFDIGIMPMPDDPWARGKCAMKALQYMGMGVPVVCSDVGANREVVTHGQDGLLARSGEEFAQMVGALATDPELRRRLGSAGRLTVERRFSARECAARFAAVLREAVALRQLASAVPSPLSGAGGGKGGLS